MKIDPVYYYYKDPVSGVEMNFSKLADWGWAVGYPKCTIEEALAYDGVVPWPELSKEDKAIVDDNYAKLYEALEKEDE